MNIWIAFIILHFGGSLKPKFDNARVHESSNNLAISVIELSARAAERFF